jgi:hypothetical protein
MLRASLLAYGFGIVLPGGRAAGEAVRAGTLTPDVGIERAAGAASRLQIGALYANALWSLGIASILFLGATHGSTRATLALALGGSGLVCATVGGVLHALSANARIVGFLRRLAGSFIDLGDPSARSDATWRPPLSASVFFCAVGRAVQAVQYGVVLHAVGGVTTLVHSLTAQGITLIGATAGDVVPNQVGATEGAFTIFAAALDLGDAPARAVAIALVVRAAQLTLALSTFAVAALVGRPSARETE